MRKPLHGYEGYTAFERLEVSDDKTNPKINLDKNEFNDFIQNIIL